MTMQLAEDINFTTEKKELLSEKIHDEILELIIKNASEEEQVLNEKRLVELFGVSKAPVREAQCSPLRLRGSKNEGKGRQRYYEAPLYFGNGSPEGRFRQYYPVSSA